MQDMKERQLFQVSIKKDILVNYFYYNTIWKQDENTLCRLGQENVVGKNYRSTSDQ